MGTKYQARVWLPIGLVLLSALFLGRPNAAAQKSEKDTAVPLAQMPEGYNLQVFEDCGVAGRQPHVPTGACHTFPAESVAADVQARSVTYGTPNFDMVFEPLESNAPYALAVTYASERGNKRIESLTAGTIPLHGPYVLPDGKAERLLFAVPPGAIENGRLVLHFVCNEGHNAVASVVELWAPIPSPKVVRLDLVPSITGRLEGTVADLAYKGIAGAQVVMRAAPSTEELAALVTDSEGHFGMDLSERARSGLDATLEVVARAQGIETMGNVSMADLCFTPPRYKPIPTRVSGINPVQILLDGAWRVHPAPANDFWQHPADGPGWSPFVVPGQWLQQGYDIPRDSTVGVATDFEVPASWKGCRIILRFDAVHAGTEYWMNGTRLGSSENLFTPVEFDVTDVAHPGQRNRLDLAMRVDTPSETASWSSNYAFHNLGGIDRSVRLFALPQVHVSLFHVETRLDDANQDATLLLSINLLNATREPSRDWSLRATLEGPDGVAVPLADAKWSFGFVAPRYTGLSKTIAVANPLKWSAEKPALYRLVLELLRGNEIIETLEQQVGFRRVEVHDGQLWLNGKRIKLAGVNRHEIDPLTGRANTMAHAEEDARLLRDANFNYIRTSHYPPTREFLDACDRLGLYVECEAPFCWARGGRGEDEARLTKQFLTPTAAMIEYHRDHPSVILWSLANESGNGPDGANKLPLNFAATLDLCRREDPSRPVVFNNEWARDGGACDIAIVHYPPFPPEDYEYVKSDPRPILIDEYFPPQTFTFANELELNPGLDVVNWSTGQNAPTSYWSRIFDSGRVVGGAIWAGIDEEFLFADGAVKGYGPWGFLDVWRRPKSLWWDAKCIHSPVWIPVRRVDYAPGQVVVRIPVENRYSFTDLSELAATWAIGDRQGRCEVSLPPQSKGAVEAPVPKDTAVGELLVLRFSDAQGRLVTAHGMTLGNAPPAPPAKPDAGCPEWHDDGSIISVSGEKFALKIERATGRISREPGVGTALLELPTLFCTRQESKNVFNPGGVSYAQFPVEGTRRIDSITAEARGNVLAIIVRDRFRDFEGMCELRVDKNGRAIASFHYVYSGEPFTVSELGLRFLLDENCQEIGWRRRTEWDVYPEDHIGRPAGRASARMGAEWGEVGFPPYRAKPAWPWYLDANRYGTRDFRATKYNVYEAQLTKADGQGIRVESDGNASVRACLAEGCVRFHVLLAPPPPRLASGDALTGEFLIELLSSGSKK